MSESPHDPASHERGGLIRLLVLRDARPVKELRFHPRTIWRVGTWAFVGIWLLPLIVISGIAVHARWERASLQHEVAALTKQAETLSTNIASLERYAGVPSGVADAGGPPSPPPTGEAAAEGAAGFLGVLERRFATLRAAVHERVARVRGTPQGVPVATERQSSGFGWRANPFTGEGAEWHSGLDVPAPMGSPVFATADGVVEWAAQANGLGLGISIKHPDGYTTVFGHLRDAVVTGGQAVTRGQLVGHVGNGGRSTGPHVHYEVRRHGQAVDPRAVRPAGAPK